MHSPAKIILPTVEDMKPELTERQERLYLWRGFGLSLVFTFIVSTSFLPFTSLKPVNAEQQDPLALVPQINEFRWDDIGVPDTARSVLTIPEAPTPVALAVPNPPVQQPVRLMFGGDVNEGRWGDNPAWHLPLIDSFAHLLPLFSSVDLVFFNAEGGLCDPMAGDLEINPRGRDVLWVKPSSLVDIRSQIEETVLVVDQANNHSMNLGDACRRQGQQILEKASIGIVGAGDNLSAARHPYIIEINQTVIGILAYAQTDVVIDAWIANREQPGVSPMETHNLVEDIKVVRSEVDFLIVAMHSGVQYEESVSMMQTRFALTAIRSGADLVIGHGPHVPQGQIEVDGKPIYFSLGNGMMDQCFSEKQYRFWRDVRKNLWLEVHIQGSELVDVRHHVFYSEECLIPSIASQEISTEVEQTLSNVSFEGDWSWLFLGELGDKPIDPKFQFPVD
jgi:hypothetical protein